MSNVSCNQIAYCNCRIKMRHRYLSKHIDAYSHSNKCANAINGTPSTPCSLASITTEPVANRTTMNVPITSATNFLWSELRVLTIFNKVCCKLPYPLFYIISNFSHLLYWFSFRVFYSPFY